MATTYYLGRVARELLADAQEMIDAHALQFAGGCRRCRTIEPCRPHTEASAVFTRYQQLPRRRPGASGAWG